MRTSSYIALAICIHLTHFVVMTTSSEVLRLTQNLIKATRVGVRQTKIMDAVKPHN